jgi:hypothetical protein
MNWITLANPAAILQVLGVCMGGLGLLHCGARLRRGLPARWWKRTRGRILAVDLRKGRRRDSEGAIIYEPVVRYAYQVGNRTLEGRRITSDCGAGALAWGLRMLKTFRPGSEVPVYYDPARPDMAVLQPASLRGAATGAAVSGLLLLAAVWSLLALRP